MTLRTTMICSLLISMLCVFISCEQQPTTETKESTPATAGGGLDRTVLPIKEPVYPAQTELDARKAKAPARFDVTAPAKAPNVVIVLIDDIGFGHSSAFGGPIHMPTLEKLASAGLKYNRFHTTALCSPTTHSVTYRIQSSFE